MAKKSFEKKAAYKAANYGVELPTKVYEKLADYREKQADMYKLKFRVAFWFVILEAIVIWILAYFL